MNSELQKLLGSLEFSEGLGAGISVLKAMADKNKILQNFFGDRVQILFGNFHNCL